jgi:hypothetical protein
MNYKKGLQMVKEMNVAGGPGGMFGYGGMTVGGHGGDVGNSDFYAPGDTRIPKVLGAGGNDPYEFVKKGKKGKKGKKNKMPLYRRTFVEMMTTESTSEKEDDLVLNCAIYTQVPEYQQIISDLFESQKILFLVDEDCVILEGSDQYIQTVLEKIQGVLTEEPFEDGEIVALMGEMDVSENEIPGGKAENKIFDDFYNKYKDKYSDPDEFAIRFKQKLTQGTKIEMEHTSDSEIAEEIATDHLWEDLDYYDKLAKMESGG